MAKRKRAVTSTVKKTVDKRERGGQFAKGNAGGPGRPKGSVNRSTGAIREFCQGLLERPAYSTAFIKAWDTRELPPRLEEMVWAYAYGRPQQSIDFNGGLDALATAIREDRAKHGAANLSTGGHT